ncbi:tetratricopeptide repeat protein [Alicyclobacillus suci]|uniref:tetratricopeptide repeat protein n=1 Tax=Alicyclobacillus suci TaxID=2816080 RepID=UPI001A8FB994|nr:tetratricopeptide repeat protein [Alicyclobacillus suci]
MDLVEKADRNIGILNAVLQKEPNNPGNLYYLARELSIKGAIVEALSFAEKAIELSKGITSYPLRPKIFLLLRDTYVHLQKIDAGEAVLRELTDELPDYPDGWFWLGSHAAQKGHIDEAVKYLIIAKEKARAYRGQSNFDSSIATWKADAAIKQFRQ